MGKSETYAPAAILWRTIYPANEATAVSLLVAMVDGSYSASVDIALSNLHTSRAFKRPWRSAIVTKSPVTGEEPDNLNHAPMSSANLEL